MLGSVFMGVYNKVKTWPLQGMVEKVLIVDRRRIPPEASGRDQSRERK